MYLVHINVNAAGSCMTRRKTFSVCSATEWDISCTTARHSLRTQPDILCGHIIIYRPFSVRAVDKIFSVLFDGALILESLKYI